MSHSSLNLSLAEPLLYDGLVRRFQTAEEREQQSRGKGYAARLEADLVRSEAKLEAVKRPPRDNGNGNKSMVYARAEDGSITAIEHDAEARASTREEGWTMWVTFLEEKFLHGGDEDFEYATVDGDEDLDDLAEVERTRLEEYLGAEEEGFVGEGKPTGETGIQDF